MYGIKRNGKPMSGESYDSLHEIYKFYRDLQHIYHNDTFEIFKWEITVGRTITMEEIEEYYSKG